MTIVINILNKTKEIICDIPLQGKISIGRDVTCSYPVDDKSLSKTHCFLEISDKGKILFTDNDSSNGSSLDGSSISNIFLKINDKIKIGNHYLQIDEKQLTSTEKLNIGKSKKPETQLTLPSKEITECKTKHLILSKKITKKS